MSQATEEAAFQYGMEDAVSLVLRGILKEHTPEMVRTMFEREYRYRMKAGL